MCFPLQRVYFRDNKHNLSYPVVNLFKPSKSCFQLNFSFIVRKFIIKAVEVLSCKNVIKLFLVISV